MKYTIYRGADIVVADVEIQGSVTEKIMGEESASLTFSSYEKIEFHIGDKITIFGRDYFLSTEPVTEKVNSRLFNYTLVFFSLKYILSDIQLFFYDNDNELTIPDFDIMGNASTCLDVILANANRIDSGWTKGTVDETEVKLISFSSVNCLEAISKLADEFELEYWIDADKSIHFTERKPVSGYSFSYGQAQGLKNIKRNILEGGSLCTRLYVKGSSQNLPKNYRSGQKNLRIDVPYLENNTAIYGVKEHTETFDIYPKYEGTVTAVSATDFNIFSDSNLDFDLNAYNEYGTTVLKAGVAAKIIFQTGQLAGYTIELLEAGGFNSATKTFYLNRVKDEADIVVPSELLRPAVGDKYIIVDIMMPETYVLAAESLLKTKAQEYLDKNSRERFQYAVVSDPFYFEAQNVNIPLGSTVHFIDSDFALDDDLRVIGKKTNVQDRYSVELELSEETQVSSIVKSYYEQQKTQNTIINNLKYNAEQARRNYLFGREFHDKVFDGEDYFKAENIKPLSIETKMLSLGSRLQQFGLPGVSFKIENNNTLINTSGKIVHQTINPDAVREWNISANSVTDISANFNYIFIKCQRVGTNASFVVSETPIKVEADADFYHFEVGYLSSIIEGYRKIKTTYGFAQLNPAELSIGRIADPSGNNFIELNEDGIQIKAKLEITSDSEIYNQLKPGGNNLIKNSSAEADPYYLPDEKIERYANQLLDYTYSSDFIYTSDLDVSLFVIQKTGSGEFIPIARKDFSIIANQKQRVSITFKVKFSETEKLIFKAQNNVNNTLVIEQSRMKLELGNIATDYSLNEEDIMQKAADLLEERIVSVETKTDFMRRTTIDNNVIATGLLMVGDEIGANAGISGITDLAEQSVRFFAGGTASNRNKALYQVLADGTIKLNHADGKRGWVWSIKDGSPLLEYWSKTGAKLFELGERGLVAVSYVPESWTENLNYQCTYTSSTYDETTLKTEITNAITKTTTETVIGNDFATAEFIYTVNYFMASNSTAYEYYNGTHPDNASYSTNVGFKVNNTSRTDNIDDGWYVFEVGVFHTESSYNTAPNPTYSFFVRVEYVENGIITQSKIITITK